MRKKGFENEDAFASHRDGRVVMQKLEGYMQLRMYRDETNDRINTYQKKDHETTT